MISTEPRLRSLPNLRLDGYESRFSAPLVLCVGNVAQQSASVTVRLRPQGVLDLLLSWSESFQASRVRGLKIRLDSVQISHHL